MSRVDHPSERELIERVGRRIGEVRAACGLTQEQLAAALGIATKNLQRLESGQQNLTLTSLARVAHQLGVDPRDLLAAPNPVRPARTTARSGWLSGLKEAGVTLVDESVAGGVPVTTFREAAGALSSGEPVASAARAWGTLSERRSRLEPGAFVARAVGSSMEPRILDGAWCVFRAPASSAGRGELALVAWTDEGADGPTHAIRRVDKLPGRRAGWRLSALAPGFSPRELHARDFTILADFVRILGSERSER